ncbi:Nuclear factor NF-kappa-B p50 subunit like [Actinidia chinensis var. chinensis]|uniref:Nuclear factor NF-kappa-B p50 subunit like n=1 Tax=Actinidia chinensis var. chinensis TaxID=1590841 RepID=A0A2R6QE14_ACTCC|nr:Nuclear factor NF-kappa-B p50 subunit like [Actinidia chinensis var. chinensis]
MAGNPATMQTASGSNTKPATNNGIDQKKRLSNYALKGDWNEVLSIYKLHPEVHDAKITRTDDTALHMAVSSGKEDVVKKLVDIISKTGDVAKKNAVKVQNERGNTPLHLAAAMGNVEMCKLIANADRGLIISIRNNENETPLFVAARNGKKDAFLCLHDLIIPGDGENAKTVKDYPYCRSRDGQTILHVAIEGEYFDLAYQIMCRYDDLRNSVNVQGHTPLHILAKNTSAFKSQMYLGWYENIIYLCTLVDELKFTRTYDKRIVKTFEEEKSPIRHPENYQTCINFYRVFKNAFRIFFRLNKEENQADTERQANTERDPDHPMFPANYQICYELIKLFSKSALIILGVGSRDIRKIQHKREKHTWSVQIMNKLLENSRQYEYLDNGQKPLNKQLDEDMFTAGKDEEQAPKDKGPEKQLNPIETLVKEVQAMRADLDKITAIEVRRDMEGWESPNTNIAPELKNETAILLAAKNGIKEMVEKIRVTFPRAIDDTDTDGKNIVLLAVESRQPHIYKLLLDWMVDNESIFRKVDNEGNSALHLAAKLGNYRPWLVSGAALQMQWEYKWYEFVKNSMPLHFFIHRNKKGETPRNIFTDTHKDLVKSSGEWLTNTAQSCSVVAALIAGVGFATVSAVPGGLKQDSSGRPVFENKIPFDIFSIAALVALCSSVTALVIFLAILTSRYQEKDFLKVLPRRLIFGLSAIFVSICAMLVSFSAGHFFVLKDSLKYMAFPVYAITCFPVTVFAMAQFPLYFDLIKAKYTGLPQRRQKVVA